MKSIEIKKCLIDSLISVIGIIGIVSIIITGLNLEVDGVIVYGMAVLIAVLFTITFSNNRFSAWIGIPLTIGFIVFSGINFETFVSGIKIMAYKFIEIAKQKGSVSFEVERHIVYDEKMCLTITVIMLMVVVGIFVALIVNTNARMLGALLLCIPFFALFITFVVIPSTFSFVVCVGFIITALASSKDSLTGTGTIVAIMITAITAVGVIFIFPKENYKWPQEFAAIRGSIEDFVKDKWGINIAVRSENGNGQGSGGSIGSTGAKAGIGDGRIGSVDTVIFSHSVVGNYYTTNTDSNQYVRVNTAESYSNNRWAYNADTAILYSSLKVLQDYYKKHDDSEFGNRITGFTSLFYSDGQTIGNEQVIIRNGSFEDYAKLGESSNLGDAASVYSMMQRRYTGVSKEISLIVENKFGKRYMDSDEERFEFARMVVNTLKNEYQYTTSPGMVPAGREALDYFLNDSKKGYCTYFATAMTLILRNYGIPARYVSGYMISGSDIATASVSNGSKVVDFNGNRIDNTVAVSVKDDYAHAWCEMFVKGYGWVVVDATPSGNAAIVDDNQQETEEEITEPEEEEQTNQQDTNDESEDNDGDSAGFAIPMFVWWIVIAVVLLLVLAASIKAWLVRTEKRIKAKPADAKKYVINCVALIEKQLRVLGYKRIDNESDMDYAMRIESLDSAIKAMELRKTIEIGTKAVFSSMEINDMERKVVKNTTLKLRKYAAKKHRYALLIPMKR